MYSADPHLAVVLTPGITTSSIESGIVGFAVLMVILLVVVRAKRSHNQKLRRAGSSGFYDFDVARYGPSAAGASLMEKQIAQSERPLAPSFVSPTRGGDRKGKSAAATPSSFAAADRAFVRPVPAFDQATAIDRRPPAEVPHPPGHHSDSADLPIPSTPNLPPTSLSPPPPPESDEGGETSAPPPPPHPASESPLPLLVQPPPPDPRSD
jgi:hypothetical protein